MEIIGAINIYYYLNSYLFNDVNDVNNISFITSLKSLKINYSSGSIENNIILLSAYIILMISIEWISYEREHAFKIMPKNIIFRYALYIIMLLLIIEYFYGDTAFIYFQF